MPNVSLRLLVCLPLSYARLGAIQVLRNADVGGVCQIFRKKALRRCKDQRYLRYERWMGVQFPGEKNVT